MPIKVKVDPSKLEEFKLAISLMFKVLSISSVYIQKTRYFCTKYTVEGGPIYVFDTGTAYIGEEIYLQGQTDELLKAFDHIIVPS